MKNNYAKMFTQRKDGYYQKKIGNKTLYDKDPEALYRKWQAEIAPKKPLFSEAAALYEERASIRLQERTWISSYEPQYRELISEFGPREIESISAAEIDMMFKKMKSQGYSKTIVHVRKTILNQIFQEAILKGWIQWNPSMSIKLPTGLKSSVRRAPNEDTTREILRHYEDPFDFLVYFLLCTGVRRGEALALLKSDIDLDRDMITISKALSYISNTSPIEKSTKTDFSVRTVPIISILRPKLISHMMRTKGNILFPCPKSSRNNGGGYYTEKSFQGQMRKYCERYGVNLTAHMLRHGTATLMFEAGVDVYTAKQILGHSNINTTMQVYTELRNSQMTKSIEKLDTELKNLIV